MTRYCLDTSAYSHFKRGHSPVVRAIDEAHWIGIPSVVLGELWLGFGLGNRARRNEQELKAFLGNPVVEELPVDGDVARLWGEIAGSLKRRGHPLPTNDIWIAAIAVRCGARLLTYDEHFRRIDRLDALILNVSEA